MLKTYQTGFGKLGFIEVEVQKFEYFKPGLHEPQLPVERSATLVLSQEHRSTTIEETNVALLSTGS